jgi:hypothetical protein
MRRYGRRHRGRVNRQEGIAGVDEEGGSNRGPVIALVVVVVLVLGGLWLSSQLRSAGQVQDCVMSGRTNCAPISAPARG